MRLSRLVGLVMLTCLSTWALAKHPANVPSSRVHVNADGTVELHTRFDILAFCLEFTPQEISDGPMNALLDGPLSELENRLEDAKARFQAGLAVSTDSGPGTIDLIEFPSAQDVGRCAANNGKQRLPVMLTVLVKEHLPKGARTISCRFPEVLGAVVVTTEMPYEEPVSEPVDAGTASTPLQIPTPAQITQAAAQMHSAPIQAPGTSNVIKAATTVTEAGTASAPKSSGHKAVPPAAFGNASAEIGAAINRAIPAEAPAEREVVQSPLSPTAEPVTTTLPLPPIPLAPGGRPPWYIMFAGYVKMGYKHILPQGLDHILFVLGLFLLSRKTKSLLTQISAFTIAHSITLALSLYGVFSLPSSIVEPLIAISIVFVAVENLFTTEMKSWRPAVVFGFGLVHGLGFAGALKDAGLARGDFLTGLVGFNAGVELGQLTVVALAFVAVGWLRSKPSYRMAVVMPASGAIALVALFWTFQRLG
jgi:hypothetical protein